MSRVANFFQKTRSFFFLVTFVHSVKSLVIKRNKYGAACFMVVNHRIVLRILLRYIYLHAFCGVFLCVIEDFIYASVDGENLEVVL